MPREPDSALAALVAALEPTLALLDVRSLPGGVSTDMRLVRLRDRSGAVVKRVLRRASPESPATRWDALRVEFTLLAALSDQGLPVPRPIAIDESERLGAGPSLWLDYVEGAPDFRPADPRAFARRLAELMARIHKAELSPSLRRRMPDGHRTELERITRARTGGSRPECRPILAALEADPIPPPARPVLIHGDLWLGNLIWREGEPVAVIDWEDACLGDPLDDIAVARLDLLWALGSEAMHAFTVAVMAGRGVSDRRRALHDLRAGLRAAGNLAEWSAGWAGFGRPDVTEPSMTAGHERFVRAALAKLES